MRTVPAARTLRPGGSPRVGRHGAAGAQAPAAGGAAGPKRRFRPAPPLRPARRFRPGPPLRPASAFRRLRPVRSVGRGWPAGSVRGRLMTPWLAAGAGIVVAAVLALNVPRAALTYSQTDPRAKCQPPSCASGSPGQQRGGLAARNPGVKLKHAGRPAVTGAMPPGQPGTPAAKGPGTPVRAGHPKPPYPAAPAEVQYQTMQRWPAGFTGLITISSQSALRNWRLAFRYPGAEIDSVAGAKWVARGDGGVATAVPWPWGRPSGKVVRIMIVANGTPGQPTKCRFDGTRCSFG